MLLGLCLTAAIAAQERPEPSLRGGLAVVLGEGDPELVLDLARAAPFVVQWLVPGDPAGPRRAVEAAGLYGRVSVDRHRGADLPYADDLVSLLLLLDEAPGSPEERRRIVRPGGEILARRGAAWTREVKPRPADLDDWTHWRHGPDRNPVSKDLRVDVPRRIQWLSSNLKEGKDMVTAGGVAYYSLGGVLTARDAFNGIPLWSRPKVDPKCAPVAGEQGVWAVVDRALVLLDARSGKPVRAYPDAGTPATLLRLGDTLLAADDRAVRAYAVEAGTLRWTREAPLPRAISAAGGALYLVEGGLESGREPAVLSLDLASGAPRWEKKGPGWAAFCFRSSVSGDRVAFETGRYTAPKTLLLMPKTEPHGVRILSAKDGSLLLDYAYKPAMRHDENVRVFFVGDGVAMHRLERDQNTSNLVVFRDLAKDPEVFPALPPSKQYFYCYPPTATERFFIYGQLSFTDWKTHRHEQNPITRGSCGGGGEGVIPANGFVYLFPKSCNCFSMLSGLGALAPASPRPPDSSDFEKGPAYGTTSGKSAPGDWPMHRGDAHRSGGSPLTVPAGLRTLWTAPLPPPAAPALIQDEWKEYPYAAGPLTPPVVAGGIVVVAQPHAHRVVALDEATGAPRWSFTANGRVDSPPTLHDGLCLFGTRTGWVYALRMSDGALAWRRRLAPAERRLVQFGQPESPWPVPGSVLVSEGTAFAAAGIHPLADGGLRAFAFDPTTGDLKWTRTLTDMEYEKRGGLHMRAGLEQDYFDLLVKDGARVALSRWSLDPATGQDEFLWHNAYYRLGGDGAYLQRGTWSYGYPMNRPRMRRPLLVARGASVLGANKVREQGELKLFRRDFKPGEKFDVVWNEQPNDTESRIGVYFPVNRIAEQVTWAAPYPGWIEAMVWAGDHLLLYAKDRLRVYRASDGAALADQALERPVWDGFAAAQGRLYVSTLDGRVLCLGGP